jgi:hypothetical protein
LGDPLKTIWGAAATQLGARLGGLRDATRRAGERVTERRGGVLAAAAVVVAVTKALEEGEDAQTHAMILAPSADSWPES